MSRPTNRSRRRFLLDAAAGTLQALPATLTAQRLLQVLPAALAAPLALSARGARAQDSYPSRPLQFIVPFSPGTGIDILARTIGQKLAEQWKSPVVVENRAGASGNIGTEAVAKAAKDGYTLLVTANTLVLNRGLFASIPYDPVRDFAPVAPLAIGNLALVVHPSLNVETAQGLIEQARANPGKLTYASPGNGTPHHLAMELLAARTGVKLLHVPYKATAGATQDLVGGQVNAMFLPVHVALPLAQGNRIRMLSAGGTSRSAAAPSVPSLAEAVGVKDIDVDIWYGMYAPAGTPRPVVERLNAAVEAILKTPDVVETLSKQGLQATGGSPEQLAETTRRDLERWARVIREAGIKAD